MKFLLGSILAAMIAASFCPDTFAKGAPSQGHASDTADYGHHAVDGATHVGPSSTTTSTTAATQSGCGGESLVDQFQPWPESEMRQFQKQ
jgi:hypothetical protein